MDLICVNCGGALDEYRCKARCPRCGYFEDCSDPSAPGEWGTNPGGAPARPEPGRPGSGGSAP
jgi:hypothetical protein